MWELLPDVIEELEAMDLYIKKSAASKSRLLSEVVGEAMGAGGKRLRPALTIISAKFGQYDRKQIIPLAAAIEILHTATLIHDDIIDRSRLRRGIPTVSEKYGADMAVYTGDFLFTRAILLLTMGRSMHNLNILARAIKTICEGEVDQYKGRYDLDTTVLTYLKRINRKTAILFGASCLVGAASAGCEEATVRSLTAYGMYYGMAFQMRDDLLDFLSNESESGKPVGSDLPKGTVTLPVIYAMGKDSTLKSLIRRYLQKQEKVTPADMNVVYDIVKESGGIDATFKLLDKYSDRCMANLDKLPENGYRALLEKLAAGLGAVSRK